jgi:opacity protein-like surface antigen
MTMKSMLAASAALIITASAASAAEVAALTGDNTIAIVDTSQKKVVKTWNITGIGGIYTVDTKTGKATMKSKLESNVAANSTVTVDFNPAADRLRLMSNDGTSLRVNVDDGKVTKDGNHKFADADMHKGEKPNVVAGAYTNSVKGTKETALYNIDGTIGALVKQAPPNDGILNAVGKLGIKADNVAFDIWSDGNGKNDAWLMVGDTLYSVDLGSGKATMATKISGAKGPVRDIAILPAM